jgi:hypothetical protein
MRKCLQCGIEFKGNAGARFHSGACRVKWNRSKGKEIVTNVQINVTDKNVTPENVTLFSELGVTVNGKFIPEDKLNIFYRGKQGKLRLAMDEVYSKYYRVPPIVYTEEQRQAKLLEKVKKIK